MSIDLRSVRALAASALALLCSACVAFGGVERTTTAIDKSAGSARNNAVLLNIVRASRGEPLYFYSISRVSGNALSDLKLSLPPITLGPHKTQAQKNFTFGTNGLDVLDTQKSGSFDVALLDSKNFYEGMLAPLDLVEVNLLLKQGFPRELVYRLAVQDVTIYDGALHRYLNDPASPSYAEFNAYFRAALDHGVTTETYFVNAAPPNGAKGDAPRAVPRARLCFDEALIENPTAEKDVQRSGNICGEQLSSSAAADVASASIGLKEAFESCRRALQAEVGAAGDHPKNLVCATLGGRIFVVQLNTRSLYGIFQYLGAELAAPEPRVRIEGVGATTEPRAPAGILVDVERGGGDCFAEIAWGGRYCIPHTGSENLKATFSILNALQALKTSPGDLPITPAVRIEQ